MKKKHFLLIGCGSVGKRHMTNLNDMGHCTSAVDLNAQRLEDCKQQLIGKFQSLDQALSSDRFDAAVICTPTKYHLEQSTALLSKKIPLFLEKPACMNASESQHLVDSAHKHMVPILMGYTWRWWPSLKLARSMINEGAIGKVLHVHATMSVHLADWHPWERYQDFFMSSRELGGGALLDESHFVDIAVWFFGMPKALWCSIDKLSELEMDCDDSVDACFFYERGPRVMLHLDLFGRPHERSIVFRGEKGTLVWSNHPNEIRVSNKMESEWATEKFSCERNDMFVAAIREFDQLIDGSGVPTCSIEDGHQVMKILDAMRVSSHERRTVTL